MYFPFRITAIVWLVFVIPQAWILGFYHDDWSILPSNFSWEAISASFSLFANRPVHAVYFTLTSLLPSADPFPHHVVAAAVILATAICIALFLRAFLIFTGNKNETLIADIGASIWLLIPWGLGNTCWLSAVPTLFSVIGFSMTGYFLLSYWMGETSAAFKASLCLLLSALSYEIFIVQVPLLFLLFFANGFTGKSALVRGMVAPSAWCTGSLCLAFLARRFGEAFGAPVTKSWSVDWASILRQSIVPVPWWLSSAMTGFSSFGGIFVLGVLATLFAAALALRLTGGAKQSRAERFVFLIVIFVLGYLLSCFVPAVAGYGLVGTGISSRINLGISFWLVFLIVVLVNPVVNSRVPFFRPLGLAAVACLAVSFAVSSLVQLWDWRTVWLEQSQVLSHIDKSYFSQFDSEDVVVLNRKVERNGVTGFGAPWDLDAAMIKTFPGVRRIKYLVASDYWCVCKDGQEFVQCHGKVEIYRRKAGNGRLWVWNADDGSLRPAGDTEIIGRP